MECVILATKVTDPNGPAMTWGMHSIGHLDLNEDEQAEVLFNRSYQPYKIEPFKVGSTLSSCGSFVYIPSNGIDRCGASRRTNPVPWTSSPEWEDSCRLSSSATVECASIWTTSKWTQNYRAALPNSPFTVKQMVFLLHRLWKRTRLGLLMSNRYELFGVLHRHPNKFDCSSSGLERRFLSALNLDRRRTSQSGDYFAIKQ